MRQRTLGRTPINRKRASARKEAHVQNGVPPQFHERFAPEDPPLPDEFNRFAPVVDEAEAAAQHKKRMKQMLLMILMTVGGVMIGFSALTGQAMASPSDPAATQAPAQTSTAATPQGGIVAEVTEKPTETPTPTPTPTPTSTPTPEPTPTPEVEGVELLYAEWVEGTGESAVFSIIARIPAKNIKEKGISPSELEIFAWLNGERTIDDWDGINTLEASAADYGQESTFGTDENGDVIVTYKGTLYWVDHPTPAWSDLVTLAVYGTVFDADETYVGFSEPSNSLQVGIGGKAFKYDTAELPSVTSNP